MRIQDLIIGDRALQSTTRLPPRERDMRPTRPIHSFLRLLVGLLVAFGLSGAVLFGFLWWEERPLKRADRYLEAGDARRALDVVDAFLAEHPQHSRALALKARSLVSLGRPAQAIDLFHRVGAADDREARAWARALVELKQWDAARRILDGLVKRDPHEPDVLNDLVACCMHLGDSRAAVRYAQRLAAVPGSEAQGCLLLGMVQYNIGNARAASEAWRHLLRFAPDAAQLRVEGQPLVADRFFLLFGRVELSNRRPDEARRFLERSIAMKPSADAYALFGEALWQSRRAEEAVDAWTRAIELDRSNRIAREGLARAALGQGDAENAIKWLKPLATGPQPSSQTASLMERAFSLSGSEEQAAHWRHRKNELQEREELNALLDQFLLRFPNSVWSRAIRAHRAAQAGDWHQARILSQDLLKDAPDESFIRELAEAVERRGALPPLKRVPIHQYF